MKRVTATGSSSPQIENHNNHTGPAHTGPQTDHKPQPTTHTMTTTTTTLHRCAELFITGATAVPTSHELAIWRQWIGDRFSAIPVTVRITPDEVSPEAMHAHLDATGELLVSAAFADHPHLTVEENVKFRAIHDWEHHVQGHCGFDWAGERMAAKMAVASAPEPIRWILQCEIGLQAAVTLSTGQFPDQRLVRVPVGVLG